MQLFHFAWIVVTRAIQSLRLELRSYSAQAVSQWALSNWTIWGRLVGLLICG